MRICLIKLQSHYLHRQLFEGLVLLDVPKGVAGRGGQPRVDVEDRTPELLSIGVQADLPFPGT